MLDRKGEGIDVGVADRGRIWGVGSGILRVGVNKAVGVVRGPYLLGGSLTLRDLAFPRGS